MRSDANAAKKKMSFFPFLWFRQQNAAVHCWFLQAALSGGSKQPLDHHVACTSPFSHSFAHHLPGARHSAGKAT